MVKTTAQIRRIILRLRRALEFRGIAVDRMVIFGSYASGKPTAHSDIDLAVISSSFDRKGIIERQELLGEVVASVGDPVDVIGYGSVESRRNRSSFLNEILHSGRVVYSTHSAFLNSG